MINDKNKKSWCVNAFHAMSANNDGSTKMCCMIKDSYNNLSFMPNKSFKKLVIGERSILENFNNPISDGIRKNLDNGKILVTDFALE